MADTNRQTNRQTDTNMADTNRQTNTDRQTDANMADTFSEKVVTCAKVCGLYFLDRACGMLIG